MGREEERLGAELDRWMIISNSLTRDDTASRGMFPPSSASDLSLPSALGFSKREARLRTLPLGLQPAELGRWMWCMVLYRLEKSDALLLIVGETFLRPCAHSVPQLAECCPLSLSSTPVKSVSHGPVHRSSQLWAFGCLTALVLLS